MMQFVRRVRHAKVRRVASTIGAALVGQALLLVTGVVAARILGPEDRGHLALIWTIGLTVCQFVALGLPLAITYELASRRSTVRRLFTVLRPNLGAVAVGAIAIYAIAIYAASVATDLPIVAAAISLAVIPATLVHTFAVAALQGMQRFRAFNVLRLLPTLGYAIGIIVLAILGEGDITSITAVWVASYAVGATVTAAYVVRAHAVQPGDVALAPSAPSELRRFGRRGLFGSVSPTETWRVDQLLVGLVLSPTALGIYVTALAFTNLPRFVAQAVGLVAYPDIASRDTTESRRTGVVRFTLLGAAIAAPPVLVIGLLAEPLVRLTFGTEFLPAVEPLRILLFATFLVSVRRVLSDCLRGAGYPGVSSRAEAVSWLWTVPALLILAGPFDLNGVAWALCGSYLVSLAYLVTAASKLLATEPIPASARSIASLRQSSPAKDAVDATRSRNAELAGRTCPEEPDRVGASALPPTSVPKDER